jgi:uncharacterized protein YodC (DUF2158 family)
VVIDGMRRYGRLRCFWHDERGVVSDAGL